MKFFLEKIKNLRIGWNERPMTEADLHRLCRRFKITITELPLRVSGFYYCVMGRHFIAVDSNLPEKQKLLVLFHELAHYMMHAPNTNETASYHGVGRKTRKEQEADMFALVALIPGSTLETRSVDELIEEGFEPEMLRQRIEVYERYRI